jgi:hypothetical protein
MKFLSNVTISASGGGPAFDIRGGVGTPSSISVVGNSIDASGATPTSCLFKIDVAASPSDFRYSGNKSYNILPACSGSDTKLVQASDAFYNWSSPVIFNTYPSGNVPSKLGIRDATTDTKKWISVYNGTLRVHNSDNSAVIYTLDDSGNITNPGFFIPGTVAYTGMTSATDGSLYYCTDCKVTSASDNSCLNGGTGALAIRLNGTYRCFASQN